MVCKNVDHFEHPRRQSWLRQADCEYQGGIHDSRRDRFESSRDRQPRVGSSCSTKRQGGAILYRGCLTRLASLVCLG
jgi:hypothetical protein